MRPGSSRWPDSGSSRWADPFLLAPVQIAGSISMLLGERWGFLLALVTSVPFWYTAVFFYFWDRDLSGYVQLSER